jgi:hypothetical protein
MNLYKYMDRNAFACGNTSMRRMHICSMRENPHKYAGKTWTVSKRRLLTAYPKLHKHADNASPLSERRIHTYGVLRAYLRSFTRILMEFHAHTYGVLRAYLRSFTRILIEFHAHAYGVLHVFCPTVYLYAFSKENHNLKFKSR